MQIDARTTSHTRIYVNQNGHPERRGRMMLINDARKFTGAGLPAATRLA